MTSIIFNIFMENIYGTYKVLYCVFVSFELPATYEPWYIAKSIACIRTPIYLWQYS